jgi:hypothetical protein
VGKRRRQTDVELELDAERPEEVGVDLAAMKLVASKEIGELAWCEVVRRILIRADRC